MKFDIHSNTSHTMQVAPYIQLNKSIRCDQMLLCLDNAISAGDEAEVTESDKEENSPTSAVTSSKSNKEDFGPTPPGTTSPLGSKHRARISSGTRHRHVTETVVSSSDMEASDKWEQEPGPLGGAPVLKEKKEKHKDKDKQKSSDKA